MPLLEKCVSSIDGETLEILREPQSFTDIRSGLVRYGKEKLGDGIRGPLMREPFDDGKQQLGKEKWSLKCSHEHPGNSRSLLEVR